MTTTNGLATNHSETAVSRVPAERRGLTMNHSECAVRRPTRPAPRG